MFVFLLFLQTNGRTPILVAVQSKEQVHALPSYFGKIHFNSIVPSIPRFSKRYFSLRAFQQKSFIQISENAETTCVSINNINIEFTFLFYLTHILRETKLLKI